MSAEPRIARRLALWRAAGVIDADTAERIARWEAAHADGSHLARLVFLFGGVLLAAGILLFVAAHWAELAPSSRFALLAGTVAALHLLAGVVEPRAPTLTTALHAVGTAALGGAVFLAGQTFHLAEHWPAGFLLWGLGAAFALAWLRDGPHVLYVAALAPTWLVAEWQARTGFGVRGATAVVATGVFVLGAAYLAADHGEPRVAWRRALAALGAFALFGAGFALLGAGRGGGDVVFGRGADTAMPPALLAAGWTLAVLAPLAVGAALRGRAAWPLGVALAFAVVVTRLDVLDAGGRLALHALYLAAAVGLTLWGLRDAHRLRVNLGVLAFALTVLSFYFSSVFDRIGRSLGLVALGVLFLGGGWVLERTRRRLLARMSPGAPP